uniref:uncharacterized protein LOC120892554 n=1 Tax=Ictidomys tridecemlineatus TaxID=43179 RepID=UPI001A9E4FDC|nr:uncharacterized protein LOC120892554 [Ictidomys tridecemlineatus]
MLLPCPVSIPGGSSCLTGGTDMFSRRAQVCPDPANHNLERDSGCPRHTLASPLPSTALHFLLNLSPFLSLQIVPREQMVEPSHLAGHKRSFCLPTGSLGLAGHNSGATCQKKRTLFLEPHRPNKTAPQETLSPAATNRFHKPLTPTQASPPPTILLLLRPIGWVVWAEPKKSPNEQHRRGANQLDVAGAAVSQSSAGSLKVCWGLFGCGSQHFPNSITNWNEDRV